VNKNPELTILDFSDLVCPNNLCQAERDGVVVYRDDRHITERFAKSQAAAIGERLKPLL